MKFYKGDECILKSSASVRWGRPIPYRVRVERVSKTLDIVDVLVLEFRNGEEANYIEDYHRSFTTDDLIVDFYSKFMEKYLNG